MIKTKVKYVCSFSSSVGNYEVLEDLNLEMYMVCFKNEKERKVEMYSFKKEEVLKLKNKTLDKKVQAFFMKELIQAQADISHFINFQTFEVGMWEDVIMPLKEGKKDVWEFTILEDTDSKFLN